MKIILFLISILLIGSCNLPKFEVKSVTIDGLGSLSSIKDKQLNGKQLLETVKAVNQNSRVNDEDARAMLEIYKRQTDDFMIASRRKINDKDVLTSYEIESYLACILKHEDLRSAVNQTTQAAIVNNIVKNLRFDKSDIGEVGDAEAVWQPALSARKINWRKTATRNALF
jgi:hypothetical protein